jgi:hypothetical protein
MVKRAFIILLALTVPGVLAASPDALLPAALDSASLKQSAPVDSVAPEECVPVDSLAVTPILMPLPAGLPAEEPFSAPPSSLPEYDF